MMTREELENSLKDVSFWSDKSKMEVELLLGEEVAEMVNFDQKNPHHCYTLFEHSLCTVANLAEHDSDILRVAAFFHDVGKTYVAEEKAGRLVFYGHSKKSAEIASGVLASMNYSKDEREQICFLISHHDDFISWVLSSEEYDHGNPYLIEIGMEAVKEYIARIMEGMNVTNKQLIRAIFELLDLCVADASAQAEHVVVDNKIVDTKVHKVYKLEMIRDIVKDLCKE